MMMNKIRKYPTYRNAVHTQSVLTITSNVVYGKNDRQHAGRPQEGRAVRARARTRRTAATRTARWRRCCRSPRSPTTTPRTASRSRCRSCPTALGSEADRIARGVGALDAYFSSGGFHVNINVLNRETLQDAMKHPEKYPQLTVRVSGYAVNFVKLTKEQQLDVINRTFHGAM